MNQTNENTRPNTWGREIGAKPFTVYARMVEAGATTAITLILSYPKESVRSRIIEDTDAPFESLIEEAANRLKTVPDYMGCQLSPEMVLDDLSAPLTPTPTYGIPYFVHDAGRQPMRVRADTIGIPDSWTIDLMVAFRREGKFSDETLRDIFGAALDIAGIPSDDAASETFKTAMNGVGLFQEDFFAPTPSEYETEERLEDED